MSARILGIAPSPSYSHQITYRPIWKELINRGHKVVLITANRMCDCTSENLTQIDVGDSYEIVNSEETQLKMQSIKNNPIKYLRYFSELIRETSIITLEHKEVQTLMAGDKKERFDLVIVESFYPAMLAFATKFNCPSIVISSMDGSFLWHCMMGNPAHPVAYPDLNLPFRNDSKLMARFKSVYYSLVLRYFKWSNHQSRDQRLIDKYFNNSNIKTLQSNVDMLFINSNPLFDGNRPLTSNTINYNGGDHIQEAKSLPKDLQMFLDSANQGAIYFSLGSSVQSKYVRDELRTVFMETFRELPYKVLWKFEIGELPGRPRNVKLIKWAPQQDILRHPNVKLFITQGGLQSLEEGLYSHVPMIGIPFMGDQGANVAEFVKRGMANRLDHTSLKKEQFKSVIEEMMTNNSRYRECMKKCATILKDRPFSGVQTAAWWAEYVIRHKGAKHLRNTASQLPCYQYFLLDVLVFFLLLLALTLSGLYLLFNTLVFDNCDESKPE